MAPWALITPASRGIGLAIARRVLQTTSMPVVATSRGDTRQAKASILQDLNVDESRLEVLPIDVLDESSISSAAQKCRQLFPREDHHLHFSFVLPGILFPEKAPSRVDASNALLTFQTNALGPLLLMKHFSEFLPTKNTALPIEESSHGDANKPLPPFATWATMSARVGSISDNGLGGWYSYRASKAAVNQLVKTFDQYLRISAGEKAMAIALHPGTVKTDLSKEFWSGVKNDRLFEAEWVAERLVGLMTGHGLKLKQGLDKSEPRPLGLEARGRCWDWGGNEIAP